MGRKKRKVDVSEAANNDNGDGEAQAESTTIKTAPTLIPTAPASGIPRDPRRVKLEDKSERRNDDNKTEKIGVPPSAVDEPASSSGYAMTSHSGQLVPEDTYVSDGSSSEDETEVVVTTSRMGIMRRGLYQSTILPQANRQWSRQDAVKDSAAAAATGEGVPPMGGTTAGRNNGEPGDAAASAAATEEAFLAKLDPAQRATWLLAEKQRREAAAILEARRQENEYNASRDPALFSKRTAFDIRFDQIDDKPWQRNGTQEQNLQHAEFFNYGLSEDDWLEYAEQQQLVRQELIDASRQKRPPDPSIVPVQIRPKDGSSVSTVAVPKASVTAKDEMTDENAATSENVTTETSVMDIVSTATVGMPPPQGSNSTALAAQLAPQQQESVTIPVGIGGAWGAGAVPGSLLAKLMEEEHNGSTTNAIATSASRAPPANDRGSGAVKNERDVSYYGSHTLEDAGSNQGGGGGYHTLPPPHEDDYHSRSGSSQWRSHRNAAPPDMDPYGGESGGWPSGGSSSDAYYTQSIPPPPPPPGNTGYYGGGGSHRERSDGGYGFRGGRGGGRGAYDGGGSGDYYSESAQTGWKRPREGTDNRRRR